VKIQVLWNMKPCSFVLEELPTFLWCTVHCAGCTADVRFVHFSGNSSLYVYVCRNNLYTFQCRKQGIQQVLNIPILLKESEIKI